MRTEFSPAITDSLFSYNFYKCCLPLSAHFERHCFHCWFCVGRNEGFVWFLGLWFCVVGIVKCSIAQRQHFFVWEGLESLDSVFFFPRSPLLASFSLPSSLQETPPPLPEMGPYPSSTSNLMNIFLLVEVLWGTDVWFISISVTYVGVPVFLPCVLPPWGPTASVPLPEYPLRSLCFTSSDVCSSFWCFLLSLHLSWTFFCVSQFRCRYGWQVTVLLVCLVLERLWKRIRLRQLPVFLGKPEAQGNFS